MPDPPDPIEPNPNWEHFHLWANVKTAIFALPSRFESELVISGVLATDLFAFNSSLGATIEEQVTVSLNELRSVWDPNNQYALYRFERQPQTFPDVVLRTSAPDIEQPILMGIELKGWYVLAKEREPSFRYKVTPAACALADLLVVVPWALSKVISGSPLVFKPYVIGALHAAKHRNWYWQHGRGGTGNRNITSPEAITHYPTKRDMISDLPEQDGGGNFGRFARTNAMNNYIKLLFDESLAGIPLWAWQRFLALFTESRTVDDVQRGLDALADKVAPAAPSEETQALVLEKFREIGEIIADGT